MTSTEKIAYAKKRINELEELIEYWCNAERNNIDTLNRRSSNS
tara:strand:+ start:680 stop:808 length:129 start_codon:yes stop_codon:yes gene_type:complete